MRRGITTRWTGRLQFASRQTTNAHTDPPLTTPGGSTGRPRWLTTRAQASCSVRACLEPAGTTRHQRRGGSHGQQAHHADAAERGRRTGRLQTTGRCIPGADGSDTEGHNANGPGGRIPGVDGGPDDFNNKPLIPGADGSDTEGHNANGPGGRLPGVDGGPDDFNNKPLIPGIDGLATPRATAQAPADGSRTSTAAPTTSATSACSGTSTAAPTTTSRATASRSAPRARTRTATADPGASRPSPRAPPTAGLRAGRFVTPSAPRVVRGRREERLRLERA